MPRSSRVRRGRPSKVPRSGLAVRRVRPQVDVETAAGDRGRGSQLLLASRAHVADHPAPGTSASSRCPDDTSGAHSIKEGRVVTVRFLVDDGIDSLPRRLVLSVDDARFTVEWADGEYLPATVGLVYS